MSPKELFGVVVRTIGLGMVISGLSFILGAAIGALSPILVGIALLLLAKPVVYLFYGRD